MKRTLYVLLFGLFASCFVAGVVAQSPPRRVTVATTKGDVVEGVLRTMNDKEVTLEVAGQPLAIPLENIRYISFAGKIETTGNTPAAGSARQDALTALRAVGSAVSGGANTAEFKKYQLEAKIKVDALPETPENAPIRRVSEIYTDASRLLNAWQTEAMSAADVRYFKTTYGNLEPPSTTKMPIRDGLPDEGFDRNPPVLGPNASSRDSQVATILKEGARKQGALGAEFGAKELLAEAAKELAAIR